MFFFNPVCKDLLSRKRLSILCLSGLVAYSLSNGLPVRGAVNKKESAPVEKKIPASAKKSQKAPTPLIDSKIMAQIGELPPKTQAELKNLYDGLHQEDRAVYNELRDDEQTSAQDIAMLWQAAVERSGTIRYAIEKLSRRDATGKPVAEDSFTKRVVESIARLGGIAGSMWTGTPAGLIGGQMINEVIQGDPSVSALAKVTDADMVILAKEIEALQSQLIETYYQYRDAKEQWKLAQEARETLDKYYRRFDLQSAGSNRNKPSKELIALQPVIESLYQGTEQEETANKQAFISAQNALGMLVGSDALVALEKSQDKTAEAASPGKH